MMPVVQVNTLALSNMPKAGSISKRQSWERPGSCAPLAQGATDQDWWGQNATDPLGLINIPASPVGYDLVTYGSISQ